MISQDATWILRNFDLNFDIFSRLKIEIFLDEDFPTIIKKNLSRKIYILWKSFHWFSIWKIDEQTIQNAIEENREQNPIKIQ